MITQNNFSIPTGILSNFEKIAQCEKAWLLCIQRIFRGKTGRILRRQNCDPFKIDSAK